MSKNIVTIINSDDSDELHALKEYSTKLDNLISELQKLTDSLDKSSFTLNYNIDRISIYGNNSIEVLKVDKEDAEYLIHKNINRVKEKIKKLVGDKND